MPGTWQPEAGLQVGRGVNEPAPPVHPPSPALVFRSGLFYAWVCVGRWATGWCDLNKPQELSLMSVHHSCPFLFLCLS